MEQVAEDDFLFGRATAENAFSGGWQRFGQAVAKDPTPAGTCFQAALQCNSLLAIISDISAMQETQIHIIRASSQESPRGVKSVFLAGTTTPFDGVDWRERLCASLIHAPISVYNPCNWDVAWEQGVESDSFRTQVEWEMDKQEISDILVIFFHPASQAPISLLELGMATRFPAKTIVACPEGYWKRGNVQIVCQKFGIEMVGSVEDFPDAILRRL